MSNDGNSHFPPVSSTQIMFEAIGKSFLLNFIWSRGSEWVFLFLVDLKISLLSWELSSKWGKIVKMQLSFKLNFDKNPNISPQHLTNHDIFYWTHNISPAWLCPPWRSSAWCCGWWRCRRWCDGGGRAWGGTAAETPWSCHEKWNW